MAIRALGVNVYLSNGSNHTYEMEADALTEVGHEFATRADYREAVRPEPK